MVRLVLEAAVGRRASVQIYGADYPAPDGAAVRGYIHVEDLAGAHLLVLEGTGEAKPGEHKIYNLGNGARFSVEEVVKSAREGTGRAFEAVEAPRRVVDPAVLVASSRKIREQLGWAPRKPELGTITSDT